MNLTNFLKQTKSIASQYSAAQLAAFIQDIGRTLPEYSREDFLKRLKAAGNLTEKAAASKEADTSGFQEMYLLVRENLKTIDSQEIALSSSVNTDYDYDSYNDWYDEEEEFCYEDNEGITDMLEEACTFIHTCMDRESYREGDEIGSQMLSMEILCVNEYEDEELSIAELADRGLLQCDLKQVILETPIACIMPYRRKTVRRRCIG